MVSSEQNQTKMFAWNGPWKFFRTVSFCSITWAGPVFETEPGDYELEWAI